ncbi:MAG: hypothetical protein JSW06_06790 [Thermoplasmatales archaeon]|nr:MAG: hypothetical protein JSW06_06790 [Thermoplasmatales archaeon]
MELKTKSYVLDAESVSLLEEYAEKQKTSISCALRQIITAFCGGEQDATG